ncbi:hypothetical protein LZ554_003075 [Drepanopeziza brunnea f. sp. 'monogermtubi']|nr:hypothetical protein LZ554_003075 [Drepanopeziza brunnea f. sp. 'monogermtubi']
MKQLKWKAPGDADRDLNVNHTHRIKTSYGSGLAASESVPSGSLILKLHSPNLLLVERESLSRVCSFCMRESQTMKRCSACKIPHYCGKACQNGHWREIHGRECALLKQLPDVPPTAVRALIVMLLRKNSESEGHEENGWKALESHVGKLQGDRKRWEEVLLQARAGIEFTKSRVERMEEAIMYLCVLSTNAFRITLPDNTPFGMCFSPTLALANHSCKPNAFIVSNSRSISLRALRPIKKNEQIFISYIDPTEDLPSRQSKLKERYFFTCKCDSCEKNGNPYEAFVTYQQEIGEETADKRMYMFHPQQYLAKSAQNMATILQQMPIVKQHQNHTWKASSLLEQSQKLSEANKRSRISTLIHAASLCDLLTSEKIYALAPYPEILHELYLAYVDAQAFVFALITLLHLFLGVDVFTYPQPHHPIRVVRLFTIAKLLKHIASLSPTELLQDISGDNMCPRGEALQGKEDIAKSVQSMDIINAFHAIMILVWEEAKKSHGDDSLFVAEVEQEIEEVEEVQKMRGPIGDSLKKWMEDVEDAEGSKQAGKCFAGLRALAGLSEKVFKS